MFPFDNNDDRWAYAPPVPERVTHLVFVDGRLVDTWREPAIGTEWEAVALRHDREALPPEPPPPAPHERVARWLAGVCGGAAAVDLGVRVHAPDDHSGDLRLDQARGAGGGLLTGVAAGFEGDVGGGAGGGVGATGEGDGFGVGAAVLLVEALADDPPGLDDDAADQGVGLGAATALDGEANRAAEVGDVRVGDHA